MRTRYFFAFALLAFFLSTAVAQVTKPIPPDERFKADILVVVAHPDDETLVTGYLAKAIFDQHKRVAVIFATRGNSGGDATGQEQAAALGDEREIEAHRALAVLGVSDVWFLGGSDTPGQDLLRSLETWNHGSCLGQTVRLIRLTRPEVIMTWLPDYVAGENHGDHQASGVIATEAFDMAGDPSAFGEQLAAPRDPTNISNLTEGLHPWQAKKLYYFTDATDPGFQAGKGPTYSTGEESPSKKVPYYKIAAEEMSNHLTQVDSGQMAAQSIQKGDYTYFRQPVRLITGKSLVHGSMTGDVFEGITPEPILFAPPPGYKPAQRSGISADLGGPFSFYRAFWQAHGLTHLAELLPEIGVNVWPGEWVQIPVLLHNDTGSDATVTVNAMFPPGWTNTSGNGEYLVPARQEAPLYLKGRIANTSTNEPQTLVIHAEAPGASLQAITVVVHPDRASLPQ
jgi:LmbE family N-acetylglucosaminyl deacetylase